jgi:hypothetical protein
VNVFFRGGPPSSGGRMSKYVTLGFLGFEGSAGEGEREGDFRRSRDRERRLRSRSRSSLRSLSRLSLSSRLLLSSLRSRLREDINGASQHSTCDRCAADCDKLRWQLTCSGPHICRPLCATACTHMLT